MRIRYLICALIASPVFAQAPCGDENTLAECWTYHSVNAAGLSQAMAEQAIAVDQPGANAGGAQARSTVTDLLPLLNLLGVVSSSSTSDGSVVIDLNFLIPGSAAENNNAQLKWALDVGPEPYEPLLAAFPEAVRNDRKDALQSDLDDTADSELQFSWSLVNRKFGRDFRVHREVMNAIMSPIVQQARGGGLAAASQQEFMTAIQPYLPLLPDNFMRAKFGELKQSRDDLRATIIRGATKAGDAQRKVLDTLRPQLVTAGVDRLAELVLQQPQLLVSATRRFRDDLVGPDALGVKVTFEKSFANFSDFLDESRGACDASTLSGSRGDSVAAAACYASLNRYLADHDDDLRNGSRWKASFEYRRTDDVHYAFLDDGVVLDVPKSDHVIASLGYGRLLRRAGASDRLDFEASYDSNLDDDATGNSRLVASLTYTRRIAGVDVPFTVVYANKSEFLGEVDKQISVHLGFKVRVPE